MNIYEYSRRYQLPTNYYDSEEWSYYRSNSAVLASLPPFEALLSPENTFEVVRANLVIRSYFSKRRLEASYREGLSELKKDPSFDLYAHLEKTKKTLPYFQKGEEKIFIPFFSRSVNRLYREEMGRLDEPPYDGLLKNYEGLLLDPFESYGPELYASLFTRLVPVYRGKKGMSFYDFDAEALYLLNDQGRLDAGLYYYDRFLPSVSKVKVIARSIPVSAAFYEGDRQRFLSALLEGRLLSARLLHMAEEDRRK